MNKNENKNCENPNKLFPSIFCKIKGKPRENVYHDNLYFKDFSLNEICYPQSDNLLKDHSIPQEGLQKAIDHCAAKSTSKEKPIVLISGGLSGIQNTVYTISSKGALKSLRARSFMLELFCEHICYELITNLVGKSYKELRNHIVFTGGGSFCLILPLQDETEKKIEGFKQVINSELA